MRPLYRFHKEIDIANATNISLLFLDQLESVLQGMVKISLTSVAPKSITFMYEATQDGLNYCKQENISEAVFLDLMADTFDLVCKYSHCFPIEHNFKNYEELKGMMSMFASWVIFHLEKETYHKLSKEEFNKLRRTNANSKIISSSDGFRYSKQDFPNGRR